MSGCQSRGVARTPRALALVEVAAREFPGASSAYNHAVKIIGTIEHIESGNIEQTEVDAADYQAGVDAMRRTLVEGYRLLSVRVDR